MVVFVSYCPLGVFATDASGKEISRALFERSKAADSMRAAANVAVSDAEKKLLSQISADKIVFEQRKEGYEHEFPNPA